jgi:hypothetical protein
LVCIHNIKIRGTLLHRHLHFGMTQKSHMIKHVRWVPCHHGMAHSQVVGGGDDLQIWRVAANILNKQSWTADKCGSPAWG